MSARARMRLRATIERDAQTETDPYGQTAPPDWQTHLSDLPCSIYSISSNAKRELTDDVKQIVIGDLRMMVPLGTDVTAKDRISNVADRLGNALYDQTIKIEIVQRKRTHLELMLGRVS